MDILKNARTYRDILSKIIKSSINIFKEEPLRRIVNRTLTKSEKNEVLRNIIQSAIPTIISTKSESYAILKNEEYMQNMVAATVSVIQGEPLSKIVDSITTKIILSRFLKQTLSASINRKDDNLLGIITT